MLLLSLLVVSCAFSFLEPFPVTAIFIATFLILYKGSLREALARANEPVALAEGAGLELDIIKAEEESEIASCESGRVVAFVASEGEVALWRCRRDKEQKGEKDASHRL